MTKFIDDYDRKIMHELDINSRSPASTISKNVRLKKETVLYRVKRLMGKNYIRCFYTIINASHFGYRYYKIYLKFHRLTQDTEKGIITFLRDEPSCINLRILEGRYDMSFITAQSEIQGLKDFLHRFNEAFGDYLLDKSLNTVACSHKISMPAFGKTPVRNSMDNSRIGFYRIDELDKKILRLLSIQARVSATEVAQATRLDPRAVAYRIKNLKNQGIIVGFFTAWNLTQLQGQFVQVDLVLKDPEYAKSVIEFFENAKTCIFAYELLGKYDLSLELYIENENKLGKLLSILKEQFANKYISYEVSHIFKHYVINWSPYDSDFAKKTWASRNPKKDEETK